MTARYAEWRSARDSLACVWAARFGDDGEPHVERVIPDGCMDLIWSDGRLFVAGPDTEASVLPRVRGATFAGVRFRPGVAPALLGVPACDLLDLRVDAHELLGDRAHWLVDRLSDLRSARATAREMEAHVLRWTSAPIDPIVGAVTRELRTKRTVAQVAKIIGLGERHLRRRFVEAVGYGPKMFERVQRLRRFVAAGRAPLATLALDAGYADQAHLARECRALTGCTPTELVGYPVTSA